VNICSIASIARRSRTLRVASVTKACAGSDKRVAGIQTLEMRNQPIQVRRGRGLATCPARQPEAMAEPSHG